MAIRNCPSCDTEIHHDRASTCHVCLRVLKRTAQIRKAKRNNHADTIARMVTERPIIRNPLAYYGDG